MKGKRWAKRDAALILGTREETKRKFASDQALNIQTMFESWQVVVWPLPSVEGNRYEDLIHVDIVRRAL